MTDPQFASATPRHGLPLLFAGQAQRELFVNESLARLDALVHAVVEDRRNAPPATPNDGQCWLVGTAPTGEWAAHANRIARRTGEGWIFLQPAPGMQVFDLGVGCERHFRDGAWTSYTAPSVPSTGATIDVQARAALAELIDSLVAAGILHPA